MAELSSALSSKERTPTQVAEEALKKTNQNAARNVYLALNRDWTMSEAIRVERESAATQRGALRGLPVSLKDCFDLAGFRTTAGTEFYAERNAPAPEDSAVAKRLRDQGAVIIGKTHLHPLAYGITGENRDFGDCVQPADAELLTGGSTSGGAASVQEGSAVAAIGTDTGGSIRVPAALCGLAGYRASVGLAWERELWRGGVHLSQTFDTLGWICGDLNDLARLAQGLFGITLPERVESRVRVGAIGDEFLHDADDVVRHAFAHCMDRLKGSGAEVLRFEAERWDDAMSIYAPIQASEAAAIHMKSTHGDFSVFPPAIGERLTWGASLNGEELRKQRARHGEFRAEVDQLFDRYDFLLLPCSPLSRLRAGEDHSQTRVKILRYTAPLSLAGTPVVTIPFAGGAGMQLAAPRGEDPKLLAYAAQLV